MEIVELIPGKGGPVLIEPKIFKDERGYFFESFNEKEFKEKVGDINFVQDNESCSRRGVIRGMHFQKGEHAQAKLVRVVRGEVVDVVVDIRPGSDTYGEWFFAHLSEENHRQFFVPRGFAHGFVALQDGTIFQYKCDNFYNKESEGAIRYDDEEIGIPWGAWIDKEEIMLSEKDKVHPFLKQIEKEL